MFDSFGSDGDGEDDLGGAVRPRDLAGRPGGRSRGNPVVDDDDGSTGHRDRWTLGSESLGAALHFDAFATFDLGELPITNLREADDVVVDDPGAGFADSAHTQFGLERHAELAHHDDVERRVERAGDFEGDRHPAPR